MAQPGRWFLVGRAGQSTCVGHASQPGPQRTEGFIAGVANGLYTETVMNTASISPISGDLS